MARAFPSQGNLPASVLAYTEQGARAPRPRNAAELGKEWAMAIDQTERDIEQLRQWIDECAPGRMVFFGGAGVSTESGIPDFRSADGL